MIRIKSYSHVWKMDGVLYNLNDLKLPFPITHTFIKWLAASTVVVFLFNAVPPLAWIDNALLKIALPFVLAWFMSKKQFEGKTAAQFLITQVTFLLRPKRTYGGRKVALVQTTQLKSDITIVRKESDYVSG